MIEKIKNFILNVLTFGLSNRVIHLTELLDEKSSEADDELDTKINEAIIEELDDRQYISGHDYDMDDFVSSGDYNFDDFITADDVDTDSIGEQIKSDYDFTDSNTVEEMITEAIDEAIDEAMAKVEKPQQISMNDVVEQLVGQTEAYKGMHLKYEAQLVQCKEEKIDLKKQIESLTEK